MLTQLLDFIFTNHIIFRTFMIVLEVALILGIYSKYRGYSRKKTVSFIEFLFNLFFVDSINPFAGFTDLFWIPIYSAYFGITSFAQLTWQQFLFYEVTTAIIGLIGLCLTYLFFGRFLNSK